jgi:prepilin-type N-terminal cleavage/methylation domain-containing protein
MDLINLRRRNKGFTLIEIMVSVAILAFGIVVVYEALLISLDVFGSYSNHVNTQGWINEKVWEIQDRVNHSKILIAGDDHGEIRPQNKRFAWVSTITPIDANEGLYAVDVRLIWKEGGREAVISRSGYVVPARHIIPVL